MPLDESSGFTPPAAFGPYRVLHQIGSGVLGPVFRTYDPQADRLVAVKAFRLDILPEDVARLADALRRLVSARVADKTVVNPIDAGIEGMCAFLATEYVSAETLDVALRHLAPAPLDRALPMLIDIADAIEAAWSAGYGHGALHPRDVFVAAGTNEARVTGFGVVPALESIGIKVPARRPYSAPERSAGEPWDMRADVYSLGVIAHELLTRRRPAGPGEQDGSLVTGTTPEQRVLIRGVLGAALAEQPDHRFASARALTNALTAIVRGESVGSLPEGAGTEAPAARNTVATPALEAVTVVVPQPEAHPEPSEAEAASVVAATPVPPLEATLVRSAAPVRRAAPPEAPRFGRILEAPVPPAEPESVSPMPMHDAEPFPWGAMAAVAVACVALGGVGGFWIGTTRVPRAAPAAILAPAPVPPAIPAGTDVVVPAAQPTAADPAPASVPPTAPPQTVPEPVPADPSSSGKTPPAAATAAAGRLVVRSVPAGATLLVDGRPHGKTPATVRDLPLGTHTLAASQAGYVTKSDRVTLTAADPVKSVTLELQAVRPGRSDAAVGSCVVESRPSGARVFIDGRSAGVTPLTVPDLKPGSHPVRFELAGYKSLSTTVVIKPGEQARVAVTLEQGTIH